MRKKSLLIAILVIVLVVGAISPAAAVTDGALDGDGHPYVGLRVADDAAGNPLWRCSGTLIAPTIFLTAGHCTEAPAARATVWFEADIDAGRPDNGYDSGGPNFIGDTNVIAGVTSYGKNGTCAGTGGVHRVDRADDLEWLDTFLP